MQKKTIYIILLIGALILVRFVAPSLFYDPLIDFFHQSDYQYKLLPEIIYWKFLISLFFRFGLNVIFTILLVKVIFNDTDLLKLTAIIFCVLFVLLTPALVVFMMNGHSEWYQYLFYIRRMLIHPVLTLILVPAYLYQQRSLKINTND